MIDPVIIGSERSEVGLPSGMSVLRQGGSALDAVEAAMRVCEDDESDHYVGTGGLPNARGEVELDASVMVGSTRAFGAVGGVRGFPHPISIARAVLELLPQHCLLVGEGAELFAEECGFARSELLTPEARRLYDEALGADEKADDEALEGESDRATAGDRRYQEAARRLMRRFAPHEGPWGTIDILALDTSGELCVGVSTSGYPWKYPGRVGDSALPGAGNYCDLRYGGAACTGRGEMAMRVCGARSVVDLLASGAQPSEACAEMLRDAHSLPDPFAAELRALALTPDGRHGGAAGRPGSVYAVMTGDYDAPELRARAVVAGSSECA
ncbi:MAG: N(4)-(beta-N-acetylglucosaminyl)-L-asparaginase [Actinomycetota bacterium]|nr:N(4)-(beta-N-acetylglucosaminyl)-L-asparaginase [Actinomycetota bacterium]